jgi:hypothetical protein
MDGNEEHHISQTQKNKYHLFSLICGIQRRKTFMKVEGALSGKRKRFWVGGRGKKEGNRGGVDYDLSMLYACMKMSQ